MPHALSITDGSTTVSLSTTNAILQHYVPQTPKRIGPGELDFAPVEEPVELAFTGASTSAIQSAYNSVQRLLLAASRRQASGVGSRVFLQYQPIGDGTLWRSEILDGDARLGEAAMTTFGSLVMPARLQVQRAYWWEGSRTQIPLTNSNGTNNTSGLTIYAHDDSGTGHDNYADVGAGVVAGVLPSPLEIQLQNTSGAARGYAHFYLANNTFDTSFSHILEGENATGGSVLPGSPAPSSYSNGQYLALSGTSFTAVWNVSATILQQTRGRYVRLLARVPSYVPSIATYLRPVLKDYYGLASLYSGQERALGPDDDHLQDLGLVALPPGGDSNWAQMQLHLVGRAASAGQTVSLDFVQLTPADELCWRDIEQRGMVVNNLDWVVDDGIENLVYLIEGGANHPIYAPTGRALHCFPSIAQRLYVLHDGTGMAPNWDLKIRAYYRPRRLSL